MGWYFRKSINFGPFRVNLSKSGIGYSIGGRGFRTGVRADGRRYQSLSIPGTGLRHMSYGGRGQSGCLAAILPLGAGLVLAALHSWRLWR